MEHYLTSIILNNIVLVLEFPQENNVKTLNEESDNNPFAKKKFDSDEKKRMFMFTLKNMN